MSTFADYENAAAATAIYPGQGKANGLSYVALKMNGEAGEFAEHVGKAMRDDQFGQRLPDPDQGGQTLLPEIRLTDERRELLIKEVGDVLWYLAAAARELGISLDEIAQKNIAKLAKRQAEGKLGGSGDNR